jgi:hypothetical protein
MSSEEIQETPKKTLPSVLDDRVPSVRLETLPASNHPREESSSTRKTFTEEEINTKFDTSKQFFKDGKYIEASDLLCDVLEFR